MENGLKALWFAGDCNTMDKNENGELSGLPKPLKRNGNTCRNTYVVAIEYCKKKYCNLPSSSSLTSFDASVTFFIVLSMLPFTRAISFSGLNMAVLEKFTLEKLSKRMRALG